MPLDIPILDSFDYDTPVGTHKIPSDILSRIGNDGLHIFIRELRRRYQANGHVIKLFVNPLYDGVHLSWVSARPGDVGEVVDYTDHFSKVSSAVCNPIAELRSKYRQQLNMPEIDTNNTTDGFILDTELVDSAGANARENVQFEIRTLFKSAGHKVAVRFRDTRAGVHFSWSPLDRYVTVEIQGIDFNTPTGAFAIAPGWENLFGAEGVRHLANRIKHHYEEKGTPVDLKDVDRPDGGLELHWKPIKKETPVVTTNLKSRVPQTHAQINIFLEALQNVDFDDPVSGYVFGPADAELLSDDVINDFKLTLCRRFEEEGYLVKIAHTLRPDRSIALTWDLIGNLDEQVGSPTKSEATTGHKIDPGGVDYPSHYNQHPSGVECIDIIEHMTHNTGAAVKYLWRAGLKTIEGDPLDVRIKDTKKAVWYLQRELKRLEKERDNG